MGKSASGQYPTAYKMAMVAFVMTNLTIIFTVLAWLTYIGLIIGIANSSTRAECSQVIYNFAREEYGRSSGL